MAFHQFPNLFPAMDLLQTKSDKTLASHNWNSSPRFYHFSNEGICLYQIWQTVYVIDGTPNVLSNWFATGLWRLQPMALITWYITPVNDQSAIWYTHQHILWPSMGSLFMEPIVSGIADRHSWQLWQYHGKACHYIICWFSRMIRTSLSLFMLHVSSLVKCDIVLSGLFFPILHRWTVVSTQILAVWKLVRLLWSFVVFTPAH